jgi:RNA polymerase sigma factor (sigma-70 family)
MTTTQATIVLRHLRRLSSQHTASPAADAELLARFQACRDEAAFAELVRRHGPMVLGVCRSVLHHQQDAEDAFQATFLVLAKKAGSVRHGDALAGFLHEVAYRAALKAKSRIARRRAREQNAPQPAAADATLDMTLRELQRVVHEELRQLPEKYRLPLVLCYLEGLSQEEAAQRLGWKKDSLRGRINRGREHLRRRLQRRGVTLAVLGTAELFLQAPAAPAALVVSTVRASVSGAPSTEAAALAKGLSGALGSVRLKGIMGLLLGAGLLAGAAALGRPAAAPPPEMPGPQQAARSQLAEAAETALARGRVLDPDGKPVAGAKLYFVRSHRDYQHENSPPWEAATSAADGGFAFRVARADHPDEARYGFAGMVTATAPGFGAGWTKVQSRKDLDLLTVRLVRDDTPLEGRVLDLQGKPIAGVRVRVERIDAAEAEDISPWLDVVRKATLGNRMPWLPTHLDVAVTGLTQAVTSDAEGRFRLSGAGRERLVHLLFEGPTIEKHYAYAMTHESPTVQGPGWLPNPASNRLIIHGAHFDHAAAPTRPVVGTVRDKATGKPLAGVTVFAGYPREESWNGLEWLRALTDAEGRYRIVGLPCSGPYRLQAVLPVGVPYLPCAQKLEANTGFEPVTRDIELTRGVLLRGRVTDKATGKPVSGVQVDYLVFLDNPHYRRAPGFRDTGIGPETRSRRLTDAEGRFTLVGMPGRGILAATASGDTATRYLKGAGADAIQGMREKESDFLTDPVICNIYHHHALAEVNPASGTEVLSCDLVLDPGTTVTGTVVDPDGKPLEGVSIDASWGGSFNVESMPSARFRLRAIDTRHPLPFFFRHKERKLAAAVLFRGDESTPVTVRLQKCGTLTGRIVDEEGQPQADLAISGEIQAGQLNIRQGWFGFLWAQTDKDGRFRTEEVVPGVRQSFMAMKNGNFIGRLDPEVLLRPGETRDLGELKVKPFK